MSVFVLRLAGWIASWLPAGVTQWIYQSRPLAGLVRMALNKAAPQGLRQVTVAGGGLAGVSLLLDLQSEKDYWLGTYEHELQAAVRDWVEPGAVAYDVGANIGYLSLLLARRVGERGRVFAFEALPDNLERLQLNVESSGLGDNIQVVPVAVVESPRRVNFLVGVSGGVGKAEGSAGRRELPYQGSIEVQGISLDHFVFAELNPAPGVVKMDIEGGEVLALPGMRQILCQCRPLILLELHGPEAAGAAWEELVGVGYRLFRMQRGYPAIESRTELKWKAYIIARPENDA